MSVAFFNPFSCIFKYYQNDSFIDSIQIFVKQPNSKEWITVDVQITDSVEDVKLEIERKKGIPANRLQLTFNKKRLQDTHTLAYYNIQKEDTLYLYIIRSTG